jgi:hypothetical protein
VQQQIVPNRPLGVLVCWLARWTPNYEVEAYEFWLLGALEKCVVAGVRYLVPRSFARVQSVFRKFIKCELSRAEVEYVVRSIVVVQTSERRE